VTAPRSAAQRRRDVEHRLAHDIDCWVATASAAGEPVLVPLSFDWDGEALLLATAATSPTGANLARDGRVRVALGVTRDVVLLDGRTEVLAGVPAAVGDRFAERAGFDPRDSSYPWFRVVPRTIRAWREVDELPGRDLMLGGRWLV
jgi:hypothetical protein